MAWSEEQLGSLPSIVQQSHANGYEPIRELSAEELYRREPHLGAGALGALEVPDEGIICPFTTPLAFATEAVVAGCELQRGVAVTGLERLEGGGVLVRAGVCEWRMRYLVNAAGLRSDDLDRMLGHDGFTVTPRRGELIVFDKLSRLRVSHIVLAVPTKITKGVLIAPTVFGNVMLGPTAEDVERKDDTSSTAACLDYLGSQGWWITPDLLEHEVTAVYVGLRAAPSTRTTRCRSTRTTVTRASAASARPACLARWRSPSTCAGSSRMQASRCRRGGRPGRARDAEHRRGLHAAVRRRRADRRRPGRRPHRLLLRARDAR